MVEQPRFRRIVLGLPCHRRDRGLRLAAEMAGLLQLDLHGLFVEEEGLLDLASLPFARELKLLGGGWNPLDASGLSRDLELAAKSAARAFAVAAKGLRTTCRFEIIRGSMARTIESMSGASDIVLLAEPGSPAEDPQFLANLDAAFHSAAAVLLVPDRIARHAGPIVAVAQRSDDPSIAIARAVASAAKEDLIVTEALKTDDEHAAAGGALRASVINSALRQVQERLVVMNRAEKSTPSLIASMRRVPVLIVEPKRDSRS